MSIAAEPGLWDFKLFRQIVVCPGCETKNRLAFGKPRPACGKCKGSLDEAKAVPPKTYQAPRFQPSTPDGERFLQAVREGHQCFSSRIYEEAINSYQAALQVAFEGKIPERAEADAVMGEIHYYKGIAMYLSADYATAVKSFKAALKPLRFEPEVYQWLMAALERAGRLQAEIPFLRTAFGPETPPSVRKALAPRYQYQGEPTSAESVRSFHELVFREDPALQQAILSP